MWLHLTKQLGLKNLLFRHTCAGITHKITPAYLGRPHLVCGHVSECKASTFEYTKFDEHWISRYQSHEDIASMTSLGIVQKPAWLHMHSRYQWNFSFSAPTFQYMLHRSIDFKLISDSSYCYSCWWWCTKIQTSNVVKIQQHSPLSNNNSLNDNFTVTFV